MASCDTCRFWNTNFQDRSNLGAIEACRRRSPEREDSDAGMGKWPMTKSTSWCGEYDTNPYEKNRQYAAIVKAMSDRK